MDINVKGVDFNEAKKILLIPDVFIKMASPNAEDDNHEELLNGDYLGAYLDGELIAVLTIDASEADTSLVHIAMNPSVEKQKKKTAAIAIINHLATHRTNIKTLEARIPICFPETFLFAIKYGFKVTGAEDWRVKIIGYEGAYQRLILKLDLEKVRNHGQ